MAATVWKGHLSFGLISIPVRLSRAARPERITLRQLARATRTGAERPPGKVVELPSPPRSALDEEPAFPEDGEAEEESFDRPAAPAAVPSVSRVRHEVIAEAAGERVPAADVVKGYEVAPSEWVVLEPNELKRTAAQTSKTIDIREFVAFSEIDPVYLESSYYVTPEPQGERAYALLHRALLDTGRAAISEVAMHGREHVLVIRPGRKGLIAHTMFYENEVRKDQEHAADVDSIQPRELELARIFVESLEGPFTPERYRDRYRERLEELISAKAAGRETASEARAETPPPEAKDDLIAALEKSLAALNKPAPKPASPRKPAASAAARKSTRRKAR